MLTKAGRYQVLEEVGHGAMGIVYRGFDPTIGRTVAIKTVLLETGAPELLKRFRNEAQAAGILSHPNIVTIYDAGEDQGMFYIAMEYVEGETLQEVIARGSVTVERAAHVIEQVGAALDHAHARHIVHRDIKPANIMLSGDQVKVMDFGVAKITSLGMTQTGQVLGTPTYMSPELVKGMPVDGRSDIFSLGVVLYEMLAGSKPFTGDNVTTVIYKILGEAPEPLTALNPQFAPGLNYVVMKALAKEPAERYQSSAELVADLKNFRALGGKATAMAGKVAAPKPVERSGTLVVDSAVVEEARKRAQAPSPQPAPPAPRPLALPAQPLESPRPAAPAPPAPPPPALPVTPWAVRNKGFLVKTGIIGAGAAALLGSVMLLKKVTESSTKQAPAEAQVQGEASTGKKAAPRPQASKSFRPAPPPGESPPAMIGRRSRGSLITIECTVSANVAEATIRVDGQTQPGWVTPHRLILPLGLHRIEVSKPGYRPHTRAVGFTLDGPRTLKFELVPLSEHRGAAEPPAAHPRAAASAPSGRLVVRTQPRGALIIVDGAPTSYHSPVNFVLPAGRHKVTLEYPGFKTTTQEVIVLADRMIPLEVQLSRPGGLRRRFPFQR